jgi:hypothetical protein
MKLFWLFAALTALSALMLSVYSTGLELVALLLVIDFMALWFYTETGKIGTESGFLKERITSIEKITSDMFEKLNKRFSKKTEEKEDIIEWLDKF